MAVTEASPMLALPSADRPPARNLLNIGALLGAIGGLMLAGGLVAAWFTVGHFTKPWPPDDINLSNYDGTMLSLTMLMSSVTVEWGIWAARRSMRSQAITGLAITAALGLAFLNLEWFLGRGLDLAVNSSAYAVLLYSMLAVTGVAVAAGVVVIGAVLTRVLGGQVMGTNIEVARAAGWFWQAVVLGWIVIYTTVWLLT